MRMLHPNNRWRLLHFVLVIEVFPRQTLVHANAGRLHPNSSWHREKWETCADELLQGSWHIIKALHYPPLGSSMLPKWIHTPQWRHAITKYEAIEYFGWLVVENASVFRRLGRTLLVGDVRIAVEVSDGDTMPKSWIRINSHINSQQ